MRIKNRFDSISSAIIIKPIDFARKHHKKSSQASIKKSSGIPSARWGEIVAGSTSLIDNKTIRRFWHFSAKHHHRLGVVDVCWARGRWKEKTRDARPWMRAWRRFIMNMLMLAASALNTRLRRDQDNWCRAIQCCLSLKASINNLDWRG